MGSNFTNIIVAIVAIAVVLNFNTFHAIFFATTDALWGNWPHMKLQCPKADIEAFKKHAIHTQTVEVEDPEECLEKGEALNAPLVCKLKGTTDPQLGARLQAAILKDPSEYQLICRDGGDIHFIRPHYKKTGTVRDVLDHTNECAGGFLYGDEHEALVSEAFPALNKTFSPNEVAKMKPDQRVLMCTSFVSNFPDDRISTGSHAAMAVSMAFQLVGSKVWILHSHEESDSHYYYRTSWRLWPNCLDNWLKGMKKPYIAKTGPGDILFFPLAYQHFVYTEKGVNIMTNIRKIRKLQPTELLSQFTVGSLAKVIADRILLKKPTGNPRDDAGEVGINKWLDAVINDLPKSEVEGTNELKKYLSTWL